MASLYRRAVCLGAAVLSTTISSSAKCSRDEDRVRWDAKHGGAQPHVAPPELPPGVSIDTLPRGGRALDVACGTGGVSIWLASERDFAVTSLDISPVALGILDAAVRTSPRSMRVETMEADLMGSLPDQVLSAAPFDLVVCQRFRAPELYGQLAAMVAPGGMLVLTVLSEVGHFSFEPSRFRAAPSEPHDALSPLLTILASSEGDGAATVVARREEWTR